MFLLSAMCVLSMAMTVRLHFRERYLSVLAAELHRRLLDAAGHGYVRDRIGTVHSVLDSHAERIYNLERANGRMAAALTCEAK